MKLQSIRIAPSASPIIPAAAARRLLLHAQGLLDDPAAGGPATPLRVARLVERWEPGVKVTRKRRAAFEEGLGKLAWWVGAGAVHIEAER